MENVNIQNQIDEKLIDQKENGLSVLLLTALAYIIAIAATIAGGILLEDDNFAVGVTLLVVGIVWLCVGWIPWCGLKILKPQEALVLTLFGKYVGTLKKDGFYM